MPSEDSCTSDRSVVDIDQDGHKSAASEDADGESLSSLRRNPAAEETGLVTGVVIEENLHWYRVVALIMLAVINTPECVFQY